MRAASLVGYENQSNLFLNDSSPMTSLVMFTPSDVHRTGTAKLACFSTYSHNHDHQDTLCP